MNNCYFNTETIIFLGCYMIGCAEQFLHRMARSESYQIEGKSDDFTTISRNFAFTSLFVCFYFVRQN